MKVGSHIRGMLVPQVAVFLQCLIDDLFQLGWHVRVQTHGSYRSAVQDRLEDGCCTPPTERQLAGDHLVEYGSKREQIRTGVQILAPRLLWRHIGDGAESRTGACQVLSVRHLR